MKRSDYKYVYNTLPKFGSSPFEKRTWVIKTTEDWRQQQKDMCTMLYNAIESRKLIYCILTIDSHPSQIFYLTSVGIAPYRLAFVSGSLEKIFTPDWTQNIAATYCISCIIF